jgi:hypothetical protein
VLTALAGDVLWLTKSKLSAHRDGAIFPSRMVLARHLASRFGRPPPPEAVEMMLMRHADDVDAVFRYYQKPVSEGIMPRVL